MSSRTSLIIAFVLLIPIVAAAQELESFAGVRLTFDRAGARSLAMGSTAIASTDPNAVTANPAAIAGSARTLSIETRRRTFEGRYIGDHDLNTIGVESATSGIRSATFTLPIAATTWSFFYDEPLDVQHSNASLFSAGAVDATFFVCDGRVSATPCNSPAVALQLPATFPLDVALRLRRYGAAAAWSRGPLAFGASLRREHLRQQSGFVAAPPLFNAFSGIAETTDDTAMTWSAGATWNVARSARVGASYSSGGSFSGTRTFPVEPAQSIELRTPPSLGVGVSISPLPRLTLAADAVRVRYSAMMHDRRNVFPQGSDLGFPDVTELHAGAEYRIGSVALRGGWWRDPAHALAIRNGVTPPPPFHFLPALVDSSENHLTAGIGFGGKTRFDASIDRGERSTRVALEISTSF
ncbi:MAG TPA: hypothetical protein VHL59_05620 [Thermoanaerobaculia bacterium]|nr:hypothetical protein [Thermoanaerobaculia bacterium]